MAEPTVANSRSLSPGKTKCYNFSFVAKTEDVGRKIEVRLTVKKKSGRKSDATLSRRIPHTSLGYQY